MFPTSSFTPSSLSRHLSFLRPSQLNQRRTCIKKSIKAEAGRSANPDLATSALPATAIEYLSASPPSFPSAPLRSSLLPSTSQPSTTSNHQDHLLINGGRQLSGRVPIGGAKNSCLVLMAAALLSDDGPVTLRGVPRLRDIDAMTRVLESTGCTVHRVPSTAPGAQGDDLVIDARTCHRSEPDPLQIRELRASFLVIAPLLTRFGQCRLALPGGCDIGLRPVDLHVKGLRSLGATVREDAGAGVVEGTGALRGSPVRLSYPSVGATETLLLAAVKARGATRIENAAREPEVRDLAALLRAMGARIRGEGSPVIEVEGVERLRGVAFTPIPDRIEAGTFLLAGAATASTLTVGPVVPGDMAPLTDLLRSMGFRVDLERLGRGDEDDAGASSPSLALHDITIRPPPSGALPLSPATLSTGPFPQFPTDLQPMVVSLLTQCQGSCTLKEQVFENRLGYTGQLQRMGAELHVEADGRTCHVQGPVQLRGCDVEGSDLRAAAALVIGALAARGETRVRNLRHLDRGYDALEAKLRALGADIERIRPSGDEGDTHV